MNSRNIVTYIGLGCRAKTDDKEQFPARQTPGFASSQPGKRPLFPFSLQRLSMFGLNSTSPELADERCPSPSMCGFLPVDFLNALSSWSEIFKKEERC
jgi:hypothetical protein